MPIYEYRCEKCDHQFDAIQKFSDDPLKDCPSCGEPQLRKLISAPSFQLKGTGWYETDFKTKKKETGKAAESTSDSGGTSSKSESSSSSESASKSDSSASSTTSTPKAAAAGD